LNKKVLNQKGFTLVEVIISISILIVIVSIAYMILNSSNKLLDSQKNISNIQQGMNLATRYLTRDLEDSVNIKLKNKDNGEVILDTTLKNISQDTVYYKYEIVTTKNNIINYEVQISKKGDKYLYSLNRTSNYSTINIISNQFIKYEKINGITSLETPFEIKYNNKLYDIYIKYLDKTQIKSYKFKVYKRNDKLENVE
jgi:prepilin-type N-terminal cleavage/methylation domain-containing protein